jgi:hypothetical protein
MEMDKSRSIMDLLQCSPSAKQFEIAEKQEVAIQRNLLYLSHLKSGCNSRSCLVPKIVIKIRHFGESPVWKLQKQFATPKKVFACFCYFYDEGFMLARSNFVVHSEALIVRDYRCVDM